MEKISSAHRLVGELHTSVALFPVC